MSWANKKLMQTNDLSNAWSYIFCFQPDKTFQILESGNLKISPTQTTKIVVCKCLLTFRTNPGDDFIQPMNISREAVINSVAEAGQCRVTSTATGGIPAVHVSIYD